MHAISGEDINQLKARFTEAGCTVTDFDDSNFQIVPAQYPVATLVLATPYYLQLATVLHVEGQGFRPNSTSKLHTFLAKANSRSNFAKFTDGTDDFGARNEGWNVAATAKLVTGREGLDYDSSALENLILLWTQDIASCITEEKEFKVLAMM